MNNTFFAPNDYRNYLAHHGVKGQKWGVRRYQNADGSYTSAGKSRYGIGDAAKTAKAKTPEEIAARNAKIKKAAITVGAAAAMAVIAYGGHKYMSEVRRSADDLLLDSAYKKIKEHSDSIVRLDDMANERMKDAERYTSLRAKSDAYQHARYLQKLAADKSRNHGAFSKIVDNASKKGSVRRAAQKAVIKRDIADKVNRARYNRDKKKATYDTYNNVLRTFEQTGLSNYQAMRKEVERALERGYTSKRNW